MLGYDISWAAFNIIEVMSSTKFTYKVRHLCYFVKVKSYLSIFFRFYRELVIYQLLSVSMKIQK